MEGAEGGEAAFGGFELGVVAAFLLDEVILEAAHGFGGGEKFLPGRDAFTEQNTIAFFRRPILAMHGTNATGVALDPADGIGNRSDASADIELKHDAFVRIGREEFHGDLIVHGFPFEIVIVIAGVKAVGGEGLVRGVEGIGDALPAVEGLYVVAGTGKDDVVGAESVVELDGFVDAIGREGFEGIVGGIAADAKRIEKRADLGGVIGRPVVVRGVEFDALVAEVGDACDGAHEVLLKGIANGVEFEADGNMARGEEGVGKGGGEGSGGEQR